MLFINQRTSVGVATLWPNGDFLSHAGTPQSQIIDGKKNQVLGSI